MAHSYTEPNFDLTSRDRALEACIDACRMAGVRDGASLVSLGVALVAWGLATENQQGGELAAEELRDLALDGVAQVEILGGARTEQAA